MPHKNKIVDPTEEESERIREQIRSEWSPEEHIKRSGGSVRPVEVRVMNLSRSLPTQTQWGRNQ